MEVSRLHLTHAVAKIDANNLNMHICGIVIVVTILKSFIETTK